MMMKLVKKMIWNIRKMLESEYANKYEMLEQ